MDRFKIGDIVTVTTVDSASAVGCLGSVRVVKMKEFDNARNEWKYLTESYSGTGFYWCFDHELTPGVKC